MDDDPRPLGWLASTRAARRLGLRLVLGEAPAVVALATGANAGFVAFLSGFGLVPAMLGPVVLWRESGGSARRATIVAQVLGTLAVLAAPLHVRYVTVVAASGPGAAMDEVVAGLAALPQFDPGALATIAVLALATGAGLGGLVGGRASYPFVGGGDAETRVTLVQAAQDRALRWSLRTIVPVCMFLIVARSLREPRVMTPFGAVFLGVLMALLAALIATLLASLVTRAVLFVDLAADRIDEKLSPRSQPRTTTSSPTETTPSA